MSKQKKNTFSLIGTKQLNEKKNLKKWLPKDQMQWKPKTNVKGLITKITQ